MSETNAHNGGIRTTVNDRAQDAYGFAQRSLDRYVDPSSRQRAYDSASAFAHERPFLFSFLVAQLLFSFLPILTFIVFSLSTVAFALGAALVFSLFWIGVAMLFLIPTVLATASVAVLVWAWAVGSFVVARALWARLPVSVKGEAHVEGPGGKAFHVVKNESGIDGSVEKNGST